MRRFSKEYTDFEFVQSMTAQITWTHNVLLMEKIKDVEVRKWYIIETIKNGWSVNMLEMQLESKLYERQVIAEKITNFPATLSNLQSDLAIQTMKDPYLFDFISIKKYSNELEIENAMINRIKDDILRKDGDNHTIGIILCKEKDKLTAEYALRNINNPIGVSEYKFLEDIPVYLQKQLPNVEDIELHIKDI